MAKLLEAPIAELENIVRQNLDDNPALEEAETVDDEYLFELKGEQESADELIRADYFSDDDVPDYRLQANNYSKDNEKNAFVFADSSTLLENLFEQLHNRELTERQYTIGEYILGSIDSDGYLRRTLQQLSDELIFTHGLDVSEQELETVLDIIHEFDPPGIGARSLQESLLLQIERQKYTVSRENAYRILNDCFEEFSERHYEKVLKKLALSQEELDDALKVILKLNPKPTNGLIGGGDERMFQIQPDFEVEVDEEGHLTVSLVNANVPELRVSRSFAEMVADYNANADNRSSETKAEILYAKQKLDAASGFIAAVKQRRQTLLAIMTAITKVQYDFFVEGDPTVLRPLKLKDISAMTGYDISTISRVTTNKYVQTVFGIYRLKFFFKEAARHNDKGEEISMREVEKLIKEAVANEDPNEPLNDMQLAEHLKEQGYTMARRTVVKYRQQLNIPSVRERKKRKE